MPSGRRMKLSCMFVPLALTLIDIEASLPIGSTAPLMVVSAPAAASPETVVVNFELVVAFFWNAFFSVVMASLLELLFEEDEAPGVGFALSPQPAASIPIIARLASSIPEWIRLMAATLVGVRQDIDRSAGPVPIGRASGRAATRMLSGRSACGQTSRR